MADGPVIQRASERALAKGMNLKQCLQMVKEFRETNAETPIVLMGYANPVECYDLHHGSHAFVRDAAKAGVDGVLIVDYPPEECVDFARTLREHGMDLIFLLAPTSTDASPNCRIDHDSLKNANTKMITSSRIFSSHTRSDTCCVNGSSAITPAAFSA